MLETYNIPTALELRLYYALPDLTTLVLRWYCARTALIFRHDLTTTFFDMFKMLPRCPRSYTPRSSAMAPRLHYALTALCAISPHSMSVVRAWCNRIAIVVWCNWGLTHAPNNLFQCCSIVQQFCRKHFNSACMCLRVYLCVCVC